jgi:hypothetical protein
LQENSTFEFGIRIASNDVQVSQMTKVTAFALTPLLIFAVSVTVSAAPKKGAKGAANAPAILWQDPGDVTSRDMVYGPGGKDHQPHAPFKFVKEDMNGTSPKFVITDADGTKWKVKLGLETHPETAANRLVWAAGYFADEDYFLPDLQVESIPSNLHRGDKFIEPNGIVHNARLKRYLKGEEKAGNWQWKENPFTGTRELNGLRVMMALINNWDLKDVNNTVYEYDGKRIYMVTDLGASFGTTGFAVTRAESKGNLESYTDSKFITAVSPSGVDFAVPSRPAMVHMVQTGDFKNRLRMEWIGKGVPVEDVKWIGAILAKLTPEQIHDAFGGAGYSPREVVGFAQVLQERIAELNKL